MGTTSTDIKAHAPQIKANQLDKQLDRMTSLFQNDDEANFFARQSKDFKFFLHSFQHLFKPNPAIARKQPLYDASIKAFCEQTSLNLKQLNNPYF